MSFEFDVLVGIGRNILTMLTATQQHPLYPFSSDDTLGFILREYAWQHPEEVMLDRQNHAFDVSLIVDRLQLLNRNSLEDEPVAFTEDLFQNFYQMHRSQLDRRDCNATVYALAEIFGEEVILPCSFLQGPSGGWEIDTINMTVSHMRLALLNGLSLLRRNIYTRSSRRFCNTLQ